MFAVRSPEILTSENLISAKYEGHLKVTIRKYADEKGILKSLQNYKKVRRIYLYAQQKVVQTLAYTWSIKQNYYRKFRISFGQFSFTFSYQYVQNLWCCVGLGAINTTVQKLFSNLSGHHLIKFTYYQYKNKVLLFNVNLR